MTIGTDEYARLANQNLCLSLEVDSFLTEDCFDQPEYEIRKENQTFYPKKLRFKAKGRNYGFIISPIVESYKAGAWPFYYMAWRENAEAMEKEVRRMVGSALTYRVMKGEG